MVDSDSEPEWEKMQINKAMSSQQVVNIPFVSSTFTVWLVNSFSLTFPDDERIEGCRVGDADGHDAFSSSSTLNIWPGDGKGRDH